MYISGIVSSCSSFSPVQVLSRLCFAAEAVSSIPRSQSCHEEERGSRACEGRRVKHAKNGGMERGQEKGS